MHQRLHQEGRKVPHVCISQYVFVSDGKVYALVNQSSKTIAAHAGHQVELTGTMKGDAINATKITMPAAK